MRTIYLLFIALIFAGSSLNDARKANEAFRNGDYEKAVELYRKAIDSEPENAMLHFNLGNAYVEMGNAEDAIFAYERFKDLSDDPAQKSLADYNIGNLHSAQEQYDEAISQY